MALAVASKEGKDTLQLWRWASTFFLRDTDAISILHCVETSSHEEPHQQPGTQGCVLSLRTTLLPRSPASDYLLGGTLALTTWSSP